MMSLTWVAVSGLAAILAQTVQAGVTCCQECGCHKEKKLVCLVSHCEELETPIYACVCQTVFCPDKSPLCKTEYRCDAIYRLHRHCEPTCGACDCETPCECWTCCTCKPDCGCKTLTAASPNGCWKQARIKKPTGEMCAKKVPTFRWVTVEICPKCDDCTQPKRRG